MTRFLRCGGLLLLSLAFLFPTVTGAQDKTDKKTDDSKSKTDKKTDDAKAKKVKPDWRLELGGKITALDNKDDKPLEFTIQVHLQIPEPNPDAQRQLLQHQQSLAQHQASLARAKTAQERQNALNQIAQTQINIQKAQATLVKFKDVNLDVKLKEKDGFRVRNYTPITEIDEATGEFKKPTKEQKDEAKGPEGYPGYKADKQILKVGQVVKAYIHKDTKLPASLTPDKSGKAPAMKADDLQDELNNFRYEAIMIYVISDPPPPKDNK
jgi:hypothetical protein